MSLVYDLGRNIVEWDYGGFMKRDLEQTIEDGKNIYKTVSDVDTLKSGAKTLAQTAVYSVTGNLSGIVQQRLEHRLGGDKYDSIKASGTSCVTNVVLGIGLATYLTLDYSSTSDYSVIQTLAACSITNFFALCITGLESSIRGGIMCPINYDRYIKPCGSALGKIVSLPAEFAIGVYDGIKKGEGEQK